MAHTPRLIDEMKKHPILYDFEHEAFRDRVKRCETWNLVGTALGIDGRTAKLRWRNIRDSYMKHIRGNNQNPRRRYDHWKWAKRMEPFRRFMPFGNTPTTNLETETTSTRDSAEENMGVSFGENFALVADTKDIKCELFLEEDLQEAETQAEDFEDSSGAVAGAVSSHRLRRRSVPEVCVEERREGEDLVGANGKPSSVDKLIDYFTQMRPSKDPIDLLFQSYAETVKMFPPARQLYVKRKMAELIDSQEREYLEERTIELGVQDDHGRES